MVDQYILDEYLLEQTKRRVISTQIVEILREAILTNAIRPGERLIESKLCTEFGTSRGPIREALQQLEEEGLVSSKPHHGTYVYEFSIDDAIEGLIFRELVEPDIARLAFEKNGQKIAKLLRKLLDEMYHYSDQKNVIGVAKVHAQFHGVFFQESGIRIMIRIWDQLEPTVRLTPGITKILNENLIDIPNKHLAIVIMAEAGDIVGLKQKLIEHFTHYKERTMEVLIRRKAE